MGLGSIVLRSQTRTKEIRMFDDISGQMLDLANELLEHENPSVAKLARMTQEAQRRAASLAKYKTDAKRYRWIRDTNLQDFRDSSGTGSRYAGAIDAITVGDGRFAAMLNPRDFNRAIDEARGKFLPECDNRSRTNQGGVSFFHQDCEQ